MTTARFSFRLISSIMLMLLALTACSSRTPITLYDELGGQGKLEEISNRFIQQIGQNDALIGYFKNTNIDRFHQKFVEHLCKVSNGPCQYSGDSMHHVHTGMHISQAHFNTTVELLIIAMNEAHVAHTTQNKVLARLAPLRGAIIEK
ncbi:MAG: group 1 truncated hemoglobin [Glaciecola sp.]